MNDKKSYWQHKMSALRAGSIKFLRELDAQAWQVTVYSEGGTWTVAHLVAHLVDSERGMSIHVHRIRQGKETIPADFDLDRWNAGLKKRIGGDPEPEALLTELAKVREQTFAEMNKLGDEEWALTGRHASKGIITVEQYYETMVEHEQIHIGDIKEALGQ